MPSNNQADGAGNRVWGLNEANRVILLCKQIVVWLLYNVMFHGIKEFEVNYHLINT